MLVKINGQTQRSFEEFELTFKEAFGRDMTPDERKWFGAGFSDGSGDSSSVLPTNPEEECSNGNASCLLQSQGGSRLRHQRVIDDERDGEADKP